MKTKPLNILIIASWYPENEQNNQGIFVEEQALLLKSYGHNVTVIHTYLLGTFSKSFYRSKRISKGTQNGISVIHIGFPPRIPKYRKLAYDSLLKLTLKQVLSLHSKNTFDIIHSHTMFVGGYIGYKIGKKIGVPHLHTEHSSALIFAPNQFDNGDKKIIEECLNKIQKVAFVSEFAKKRTLEEWNIPTCINHIVLPNVVNHIFFDPEFVNIPYNAEYILIGNMQRVKQMDLALRAWKKFSQRYPNARLTLAGDGPMKEELIELSRSLDLEQSVQFKSRLSRQEVKDILRDKSVLISSSKVETFGLVLAEAQSLGIPTVATNSGGVEEVVTSETGILTSNTVEDFAEGLVKMHENFNGFDSKRIKTIMSNKFSQESVYTQIIKEYYSLLETANFN